MWDPIAGNYATRDGWIRLHTNAPHHRDAALGVLRVRADKAAVADAVRRWERRGARSRDRREQGCAGGHALDRRVEAASAGTASWRRSLRSRSAHRRGCDSTWTPAIERPLRACACSI
jgi:hypothetical protein